jgi:beta-glucosidase
MLDGPVLCQIKIPNTKDFQNWTDIGAPITHTEGEHSLYLLYIGEPGPLFGLQHFELTPATPLAPQNQSPIEATYALGCTVAGDKNPVQFQKAVQAAGAADVVLVIVGVDEQISTEGLDRRSIDLPGAQNELVDAILTANPQTVVVVSSNAPVAFSWKKQDRLPAIVGGLFLGQQQGRAIAEVLFGKYNPGGKLSTTWYHGIDELPDFHDYKLMSGRTYMYFKGTPLYPFGHGLSYTTFKYDNLKISDSELTPARTISISCAVTNTGSIAGDEVVQFYVRASKDSKNPVMPIKQLINFERVHLVPNETKQIKFELPHSERALSYWNEDANAFTVVGGVADLLVGSSSEDIRLKGNVRMG